MTSLTTQPPADDRLADLTAGLPDGERDLVAAAAALVPVMKAHAGAADATRTLPDAVVTALHRAGLFRLATPRAYGGHQAGTLATTAVVAELGRGCPSAAWVLTVYYSAGLAVWMFPDEVRRRVWEKDPGAAVCGSSGAAAPARPTPGGFVLSGRWGWASGAHHAAWVILDIVVDGEGPGIALVPMSELTIEDTWHMTGMRGTGSDSVLAADVFVPEDQVLVMSRAAAAVSGTALSADTTTLPRPQGLLGTMAAPLLGMGLGMYDHVVGKLTAGRPLSPATSRHARAIDAPGVRANVVDAAVLIDSAILQAGRSARVVDRATRAGDRLTPLAEMRIRMDAGFAARQVRRAVDKLLDVGGASRFAESDPAQRIWRDLGTAMRHPAYAVEVDRERYADLLLPADDGGPAKII